VIEQPLVVSDQQHAAVRRRPLLTWDAAKANRLRTDWRADAIATPAFTGARVLDAVRLEEVVPYIDWTFFFSAWELKGRFPAILEHPQYGDAARKLYEDAQALLKKPLTAAGTREFHVSGPWADPKVERVGRKFGDDVPSAEAPASAPANKQ